MADPKVANFQQKAAQQNAAQQAAAGAQAAAMAQNLAAQHNATQLPVASGPQYTPEQQAYINYWYYHMLQTQQALDANGQKKYANDPEALARFRQGEQNYINSGREKVMKQVKDLPVGTGYRHLLAEQRSQPHARNPVGTWTPNLSGWDAGGVSTEPIPSGKHSLTGSPTPPGMYGFNDEITAQAQDSNNDNIAHKLQAVNNVAKKYSQ